MSKRLASGRECGRDKAQSDVAQASSQRVSERLSDIHWEAQSNSAIQGSTRQPSGFMVRSSPARQSTSVLSVVQWLSDAVTLMFGGGSHDGAFGYTIGSFRGTPRTPNWPHPRTVGRLDVSDINYFHPPCFRTPHFPKLIIRRCPDFGNQLRKNCWRGIL